MGSEKINVQKWKGLDALSGSLSQRIRFLNTLKPWGPTGGWGGDGGIRTL